DDAFFGKLSGEYWHIYKTDNDSGSAYSVSHNYIARRLYDRLPEDAEQTIKLARLVSDYGRDMAAIWKEKVTVNLSDEEQSERLGCALYSPVACITRICTDRDGNILYLGNLCYLGSRYETRRDITHLLTS
ncbi:MAG: UTRA domain-containing protein, partial [Pseudomonadota bacterium]|nr:UTRA domain-containing protein [Pseudomonadota bacterium]